MNDTAKLWAQKVIDEADAASLRRAIRKANEAGYILRKARASQKSKNRHEIRGDGFVIRGG